MKCPLCNSELKESKNYFKCKVCKLDVERDCIDKIKDVDSYYKYVIERYYSDVEGRYLRNLEKTLYHLDRMDLVISLLEFANKVFLDEDSYEPLG